MKTWSATPKIVTLSSSEAELMAAVRASTETIGTIQMAAGWGLRMSGASLFD